MSRVRVESRCLHLPGRGYCTFVCLLFVSQESPSLIHIPTNVLLSISHSCQILKKTGYSFILNYRKEKGEHSRRKTGIPLHHVRFNCMHFSFVALALPFCTARPYKQSGLLPRRYAAHVSITLREQLWISFQFANHLHLQIRVQTQ